MELFTIKLDLSEVVHDSQDHKLYILLIDPNKMKRIYEFKLWIRFLFSIRSNVILVYENAVIHDLEDIQILSVLKIVQVKPTQSAEDCFEQEQFSARLIEYSEWLSARTPRLPVKKPDELCSNINDSVISNQSWINTSQKVSSSLPLNGKKGGCYTSPGKSNSSDGLGDKLNNTVNKEELESGMLRCKSGVNKPVHTGSVIESVLDDSGVKRNKALPATNGRTGSINNSRPMRTHIKPFSMYDILNELRSNPNNCDKEDLDQSSKAIAAAENSVEVPSADMDYNCGSEGDQFVLQKKSRKRIRKHKSKRKNTCIDSVNTFTYVYEPTSCEHNSSSESHKPKHIRFDEEEDEIDCNGINPSGQVDDERENEVAQCEPQVLSVEKLKDAIEEKRKSLENNLNRVDNNRSELKTIHNETYIKESNALVKDNTSEKFSEGELHECEDEVLESGSSKTNLLSWYLNKKSSSPVVFNRFA